MDQYRKTSQFNMPLEELIIDSFAGGGGASTGIEAGIGRPVDVAINHDPDSITMHKINHPTTKHYCEDVWELNPRDIANGSPVGLAWFSPDCKHFSKAKGGTPVDKNIRGLAWLAVRYAATIKPRIIILENVEEFTTWGPLVDGRPCKKNKGRTFNSFKNALKRQGYAVETRVLRASDYGVPTIRKRLFLVARNDGVAIAWPVATHGDPSLPGFKAAGLKPWRTAGEIIDWSIPCKSIFERKKPLAENTMRRIYKGIQKFVLDNPEPFIVRIGQQGYGGDGLQYSANQPLTTVTSKAEHCLVTPEIAPAFLTRNYGGNVGPGANLNDPLPTTTTKDHSALVMAFLTKFRTGAIGSDLSSPLPTVTAGSYIKRPGGAAHALGLVATSLVHLRNNAAGRSMNTPLPTLTAGGGHVGEVRAFLMKYYTTGAIGQDLNTPLHTVMQKERFGLITIKGEDYQIVDIGMRMLEPHELFAAHGFPADYIIDRDSEGNKIPKYKQVARCGNSVPPKMAEVISRANYQSAGIKKAVA